MFKGYRTVIYNVVSAMLGLTGILMLTDLSVLGLTPQQVALTALGLKLFDNLANLGLRAITTSPMGEK